LPDTTLAAPIPLQTQHAADDSKLEALVELPCFFELQQYSGSRSSSHLRSLLNNLRETFERAVEVPLLEAVCKTLLHLSNSGLALASHAVSEQQHPVPYTAGRVEPPAGAEKAAWSQELRCSLLQLTLRLCCRMLAETASWTAPCSAYCK